MSNREFNFTDVHTRARYCQVLDFFNSILQDCSINSGLFLSFLRKIASVSVSTWQMCNPGRLQNVTAVSVWIKTQVLIAVLKKVQKKRTWHIVLRNITGFCEATVRCTSALNTLKGYMKLQVPHSFRKKIQNVILRKYKVFIFVKLCSIKFCI